MNERSVSECERRERDGWMDGQMSLKIVRNDLIGSCWLTYQRKGLSIDECLFLFFISEYMTMKSVNNCVQEFVDHHSSTLFPNDPTTNNHRPRISRFNSISSSSVEIEDEDPSLSNIIFFHR